jgi:hypothetical protein
MNYIYKCDCGITLEYELFSELMDAFKVHDGSDQTHLAWEHEAQK